MHEPYATVPGDVIFPQDFHHRNVLVYHYIIKGDLAPLQGLCNSWLNVTWQQRYKISPRTPYLLVSFYNATCHLGQCSAAQMRRLGDEGCGMDCSRSVLKGAHGRELGFFKFNFLAVNALVDGLENETMLFSPYSFCDDGTVTANYREMFGWNVLFAEFDFPLVTPDMDKDKFGFSCAIDVPRMSLYGDSPPERMLQLLEAQPEDLAAVMPEYKRITDAILGIPQYLSERFAACDASVDVSTVKRISDAVLGKMKRLSLRQFRGTPSGNRAIFQSIQTFGTPGFEFKAGGIISPGQTMLFPDTSAVANLHFPMRKELGLPAAAEVVAGIWTLCDFSNAPMEINWSGVKKDR